MWFLSTCVYLAVMLTVEGMGFRWDLLCRLPFVGSWISARPVVLAALQLLMQGLVFGLVHVLLWGLGLLVNWFAAVEEDAPGPFEQAVQLVHSREEISPLLLYVLALVPLSLFLSWWGGRFDAVSLFIGLLLILSAAYVLRPFSFVDDLFPALIGLPGRFLREQRSIFPAGRGEAEGASPPRGDPIPPGEGERQGEGAEEDPDEGEPLELDDLYRTGLDQ